MFLESCDVIRCSQGQICSSLNVAGCVGVVEVAGNAILTLVEDS